jgi:hypothetical protein
MGSLALAVLSLEPIDLRSGRDLSRLEDVNLRLHHRRNALELDIQVGTIPFDSIRVTRRALR